MARVTQNPIEHLDAFSEWLASIGNQTNTIWSHRGRLLQIGRWHIASKGKPLSPNSAAPWTFEDYSRDDPKADRSSRSSLSRYADWAVEAGLLSLNPFRPFDKFEPHYRQILKDQEYSRLTTKYKVGAARSFVNWYVGKFRHQLGDRPLPSDVVKQYRIHLQKSGYTKKTITGLIPNVYRFLFWATQTLNLDASTLTLPYPRRLIIPEALLSKLSAQAEKYPEDQMARAFLLLHKGMSVKEVAAGIGVAAGTVYNWTRKLQLKDPRVRFSMRPQD